MPCYFGLRDPISSPRNLPEKCIICWEKLGLGDSYRRLPCNHVFHCFCIDVWLCEEDASCPLCRRTFYELRRPRAVIIRGHRSIARELPTTLCLGAVKAWFARHFLKSSTCHDHG
ncbi:hypothetical protein BJY01DRAFT_210250 [Aspergillus pseudoustus]|uniref:RING-type domain-containing protein n=1 Tax=Aspergillus pseudoustus TaxID=1810923 RepID=A0ABR4KCA1_9EURO